jgi:hypothetical protein
MRRASICVYPAFPGPLSVLMIYQFLLFQIFIYTCRSELAWMKRKTCQLKNLSLFYKSLILDKKKRWSERCWCAGYDFKNGCYGRHSIFLRNPFLIFYFLLFFLFLYPPFCLNSQFFDLFMNRLVIDLEQPGCFSFVSSSVFEYLGKNFSLHGGGALLHDLLKR